MPLDQRRFLTARQISRLFWRHGAEGIGDREARARALAAADRQVNRRILRPLKDAELVTVVRPFLTGETTPLARKEVNVLTSAGAALVREAYLAEELGRQLKWHRGLLAIDNTNQAHAALLNDWFIVMRRAVDERLTLRGWRDDRDLAQLTQQGATLFAGMVPDAVFVLSLRKDGAKDDHVPFLLELDRGTETVFSLRQPLKDWTAKIERYLTYLAGPQRADPLWTGIVRTPQVLTLAATITRRDHQREAAAAAGADDRFWFATYQPLLCDRDPVALFWESEWQRATGRPITMRAFLRESGRS
ncbi:MAG: replication-relaxation family protein [Thermomicrobiales bacterium]